MDALYNSKHPLVRFVHRNRLEAITKELPDKTGLRILDAGCGEGHLLKILQAAHPENIYFGIDITEAAIQKATTRCPFAHLTLGDIADINTGDDFFDIIICTEVLEHIMPYQIALKELKRVLKGGGYLIITFPNEPIWMFGRFFLGRRPVKVPDHINSFTSKKMKTTLGIPVLSERGLPFRVPFFISLGWLMKFKKYKTLNEC